MDQQSELVGMPGTDWSSREPEHGPSGFGWSTCETELIIH